MVQLGRTWLFVPAKEKFTRNFDRIDADEIILDLEDSLNDLQKEEGLRLALEIVKKYGNRKSIYIRINTNERFEKELIALDNANFTGYMIPKFENIHVLEQRAQYFEKKKVIALIESVKGVVNVKRIASHPSIYGLAFGGEDYCKSLGYYAGQEATVYARNKIVLYASYYKKYSLDTISLEINDKEIFLTEYWQSRRLGFDSKLLIHPNQVCAINSAMKNVDINRLKKILEIYESRSEGVVKIEDTIYEKPHIEKIKAFIKDLEG